MSDDDFFPDQAPPPEHRGRRERNPPSAMAELRTKIIDELKAVLQSAYLNQLTLPDKAATLASVAQAFAHLDHTTIERYRLNIESRR